MSNRSDDTEAPSSRPPSAADPAALTLLPSQPTGADMALTLLPSQPTGADMAASLPSLPGYEILGELGRGGMGAVFRGRDPDLGRELAVKVLLERHQDDPRAVERFVEEAQVGGQLQHPGVVPVYEAGRLPDDRPYFTMKLVEGRTLAALLKERDTPARDLPRFLQMFQQMCQTLAYAHSRGVIHRDLKPANVMVGAFGELQVMDWGLAKVVRGRGVRTVRSEAAEGQTEAGSVVGTPAYMAPEQACGDVEGLDERCDVFGLGAILCEILTGSPPYRGLETGELLRKAARADLSDALGRLDGCGAEGELVGLAKACLAAESADRPRDGGAVAAAMTAYLAGVQERLRQSELERAAAHARAEAAQAKTRAERRARRMTVALAATLLLAVTGVGAGALWYQHDRAARSAEDARLAASRAAEEARLAVEHARKAANTERDVTAALEEAMGYAKQAAELHADPAKWDATLVEALSAVKRASAVLNSGVDDTGELGRRVEGLRAELGAADRDPRMVARLEAARFQVAAGGREGDFDKAGAIALYAAAFRQDDEDWDSLQSAEAAARINRRAIREALLAALDDWAVITANKEEAKRLQGIVQAADPDPGSLRNRLQALLDRKDWDGLRRLAFSPDAKDLPTGRLDLIGWQLINLGAASEAVRFLKEANERRPGDFWIVYDLAYACDATKPHAADEVIRYYTAALMLRPKSTVVHSGLAAALYDKHELDEAIAEYRKVIELKPDYAMAHNNLGIALDEKHLWDEAIAEYRKALQIQPDDADAHNNLGVVLRHKHELDEAIAEYRKAIELKPDYAMAHNNLGFALSDKGQSDEAIAEYRKALQIQPDYATAHTNLGLALYGKHELDEAIAEYRKALQIQPDDADVHNNLGSALYDKHQLDEAITEYRKALQIQPDYAMAHNNLGSALYDKHELDEAIAEYRKAIELKPDYAMAHNNLGFALSDKGQSDEAIAEYRKALQIQPDYATAHTNLGNVLDDKGRSDEAIAEYRKALQIQPDDADAHNNLGVVLRRQSQLDEAIVECRKAIELKPDFAEAHYNLGLALKDNGQIGEAITEYRKALQIKPDWAVAHSNLGLALRAKGLLDEAIAEYRQALQIQPGDANIHNNLGFALRAKGLLDEAIAEYRKALQIQPDYAPAHYNLGLTLSDKHQWDEAITEYRQALQIQPDDARAPYYAACAAALASCWKGEDAAKTDEKERSRWRKQALDWLRVALNLLTKKIDDAKPEDRAAAAKALSDLQQDSDLAGVRDKDALAKLPPEEQDVWRQLWADVDALLKKAQEK